MNMQQISPNPMQDLIDKGLISSEYQDCQTVKSTLYYLDGKIAPLFAERFNKLCSDANLCNEIGK
jgi:hypothetical protein